MPKHAHFNGVSETDNIKNWKTFSFEFIFFFVSCSFFVILWEGKNNCCSHIQSYLVWNKSSNGKEYQEQKYNENKKKSSLASREKIDFCFLCDDEKKLIRGQSRKKLRKSCDEKRWKVWKRKIYGRRVNVKGVFRGKCCYAMIRLNENKKKTFFILWHFRWENKNMEYSFILYMHLP